MGRALGSKNKSVNLYKQKFCPKGHDKDMVGRTVNGACKVCQSCNIKIGAVESSNYNQVLLYLQGN